MSKNDGTHYYAIGETMIFLYAAQAAKYATAIKDAEPVKVCWLGGLRSHDRPDPPERAA